MINDENQSKNKLFSDNKLAFIQMLIKGDGEVSVAELEKKLGVSRATVHNYFHGIRGLNLSRKRGKIILSQRSGEAGAFVERQSRNQELKEKVAGYAVDEFIEHGDILFIDCGTTTLFLVDHIIDKEISDLTVITTNPYVMTRFITYEKLRELSVIGGIVNRDVGLFYGHWANRLLTMDYRFQKVFMSADGLSFNIRGDGDKKEGRLTISNSFELNIKRSIISKANEIYILIDETKIDGGGEIVLRKAQEGFILPEVPGTPNSEVVLSQQNIKIILAYKDTDTGKIDSLKEAFGEDVIIPVHVK